MPHVFLWGFFIKVNMKQLNDKDIAEMLRETWCPDDDKTVKSSVRHELQLSKKIPVSEHILDHITLDLHQHTEQESWDMIINAAQSGVRTATIITGASGILKVKFQQWAKDSLLTPYVVSWQPINNGSFSVKFKKLK